MRKRRGLRIQTKRIYEAVSADDGTRILIDRLWPRGVAEDKAAIDFWARAAAPSAALRRWYQHDPDKWPEFRRRYFEELDANPQAVAELREAVASETLTIVFASKELEWNNATALREYLETRAGA